MRVNLSFHKPPFRSRGAPAWTDLVTTFSAVVATLTQLLGIKLYKGIKKRYKILFPIYILNHVELHSEDTSCNSDDYINSSIVYDPLKRYQVISIMNWLEIPK